MSDSISVIETSRKGLLSKTYLTKPKRLDVLTDGRNAGLGVRRGTLTFTHLQAHTGRDLLTEAAEAPDS